LGTSKTTCVSRVVYQSENVLMAVMQSDKIPAQIQRLDFDLVVVSAVFVTSELIKRYRIRHGNLFTP